MMNNRNNGDDERKRAERALRKQKNLEEDVFDNEELKFSRSLIENEENKFETYIENRQNLSSLYSELILIT